jgi:hypothetical protein
MRYFFVVLSLLLVPLSPAVAQVSFQMGLPGINIGINQPVYPRMVAVPGYPVYYAPDGNSNYFFYDGKYWVYQGDNWYASSWYNGPWSMVAPQVVPAFILRVRSTFTAGAGMRRRAGASTGATTGSGSATAGTSGTTATHPGPLPCRSTRSSIRGIATRTRSCSSRCRSRTTATSRGRTR